MNNKRIAKGILIIVVIILSFSVLGIVYFKTDLLKTKEQLFWKYLLIEKDNIVSVFSNDEIKEYNSKLQKSSYIKEGSITISSKSKLISPINIKASEKGNNKEDYKNLSFSIEYKNKNYANTSIIKDENYYFIKNDDISNDYYIGFENKNLKQLASSIGINNTEFIPDQINDIDYLDLFTIEDKEINRILKKYIPICRKHVKNRDYNKEEISKDYTVLELNITREQLKNVLIDVLDELKDDRETVDLICYKIRKVDKNSQYGKIDNFREKVIELKEYIEKQEADSEQFLSIIIYKNKNNVEKAEIILKDDRKISIEKQDDDKVVIKQYDVKNKGISFKGTREIFRTIFNNITEITFEKHIKNGDTNNVEFNIVCDLGIETLYLKYNYVEQIKNNVDDIIRKDEIDYIDLKEKANETYKNAVEKVLRIETFLSGKKY